MDIDYRLALPDDIAACVDLRGRTRENAVSPQRLAALGITVASWSAQVREGELVGHVAWHGAQMAGYAFGDVRTGEVVVLALLPDFEGRGVGATLLSRLVADLRARGHARLFLGCASDPAVRSHGFYRHLGWRPTGRRDRLGDEELELLPDDPPA
ncbi:GNAT family N-acetyltransferase [Pelomonas sp. APW6]|uniref:GNAT family N-acetyltransferase n=1 Tax=Roseateles subflavus TaxID=3053353 RepID=A0ABT7LCF1_9BURK|nr:GNAT family N-acetyltransferase [Pelomonas sp. APW6]MDL5030543.1 GNAT family N-acetyltransferase [Pelomonas sp. APW6]